MVAYQIFEAGLSTLTGMYALQRLRQLHSTFGPLRPIDADVALVAARLRAKHRALRLPDALVLAVAHVDAADVILTADRKWSGYDQRVRLI